MKNKRGFTLIELLVVIAIIALLLSVMLPSLRKAKSHAQRVVDLTNQRSLSIAIHLYLDASQDKFFEYSRNFLWVPAVGKMVDNIDQVRYSPKTMGGIAEVESEYAGTPGHKWGTAKRPWLWGNSPDPSKKYEMGSYGLNGWLYAVPTNAADLENFNQWVPPTMHNQLYAKRTAVRNPSRTPAVLDACWVDAWPLRDNNLPTNFDYSTGNHANGGATAVAMMGRYIMNRNGAFTSVVFMDGQAASVPHADLWTLSWHRGYQPRYDVVLPRLN